MTKCNPAKKSRAPEILQSTRSIDPSLGRLVCRPKSPRRFADDYLPKLSLAHRAASRLGVKLRHRGMSASRQLYPGGLNRSTQHLEQLAINNDDGLPNRSPKCFQRVPPQPAIPITGFALPPSYHHEISDLSANNRSLPSKGKCCVDRLNPPPRKPTFACAAISVATGQTRTSAARLFHHLIGVHE